MLQHAGIEVKPADLEATVEFFSILGFDVVPTPFESGFTCPQIDATLARLQEHGFEVERRREHWGEPRALAVAPGGHRVELMKAPPPRSV